MAPVWMMLRCMGWLLLMLALSGCGTRAGLPARATAPEPKSLDQVVVDELVADTQILRTDASGLAQAWWVPIEFWQVSLGRINPQLAQQVESVLGDYSIIAVVQADVSALGGFVFYSRDELQQRLSVSWQPEAGAERQLQRVENPNMATRNLVQQLTPLLSRSMGEMGRNLQFFVLSDRDETGARVVSPYAPGALRIRLDASEAQPATTMNLDLPLNALYKPRYCANGKPAHITWKFCPWDGAPL